MVGVGADASGIGITAVVLKYWMPYSNFAIRHFLVYFSFGWSQSLQVQEPVVVQPH